jgi:hypothetical protein
MTAASNLLARIAALHPSDRQWLLAQASAETRMRLTVALEAAQAAAPDNRTAVVYRGAPSARDMIASATPEHVARALQTQPEWLSAVLLRMDEWPWVPALLKRTPGGPMGQPVMQRQMPRVGQPTLALKPALAGAILKSFARSLALIEASAMAPSPRLPPFEALVQRFRRGRGPQESGF